MQEEALQSRPPLVRISSSFDSTLELQTCVNANPTMIDRRNRTTGVSSDANKVATTAKIMNISVAESERPPPQQANETMEVLRDAGQAAAMDDLVEEDDAPPLILVPPAKEHQNQQDNNDNGCMEIDQTTTATALIPPDSHANASNYSQVSMEIEQQSPPPALPDSPPALVSPPALNVSAALSNLGDANDDDGDENSSEDEPPTEPLNNDEGNTLDDEALGVDSSQQQSPREYHNFVPLLMFSMKLTVFYDSCRTLTEHGVTAEAGTMTDPPTNFFLVLESEVMSVRY